MPLLILYFLLGLVGLWLGAELITRSAQKISRMLGLSETFVGLTILAFGTDFPEIMIAVTGAIEKNKGVPTDGIVVGNILGSTMAQISLVLGLAGFLKILKIKKRETIHNGIALIISTVLFFFLALDGTISKGDGLIFLVFYLFYFLTLRRQTKLDKIKKRLRRKKQKPLIPTVQLVCGLLVIGQASHMVLNNGIKMAELFGVSQLMIGIILVGIGTSLPELVVSITAVLKGSVGLSVGNLIGSNIVDVLVALGTSSFISGWSVERSIVFFDIPYLMFTCVVVVLFLFTKEKLERKESILIFSLYVIYIALKFNGW